MNWTKWSSIAEISTTICIVFSLIFVGIQINSNTNEARATTVQAALEAEMLFQTQVMLHPDIWEKVVQGETLSPGAESRRGLTLFNMFMTQTENRYHQIESGLLEGDIGLIAEIVTSLSMYENWRQAGGTFSRSPEFLAIFDAAWERRIVE